DSHRPRAPEELDVGMNQFAASRNSATTLVAAGGPCPIVVFRRHEHRASALIHISGENAEHDGSDHETLVPHQLAAAPELDAEPQVCTCFDPAPAPGIGLPADLDAADLEAQKHSGSPTSRRLCSTSTGSGSTPAQNSPRIQANKST